MIDLRDLKAKIQSDERLKHSPIQEILNDQPDTISEEQFLMLLPILLKFGKSQEVLA